MGFCSRTKSLESGHLDSTWGAFPIPVIIYMRYIYTCSRWLESSLVDLLLGVSAGLAWGNASMDRKQASSFWAWAAHTRDGRVHVSGLDRGRMEALGAMLMRRGGGQLGHIADGPQLLPKSVVQALKAEQGGMLESGRNGLRAQSPEARATPGGTRGLYRFVRPLCTWKRTPRKESAIYLNAPARPPVC